MDQTYRELYERWKRLANEDTDLIEELNRISGDDAGIEDRFYRDLEFGTGGLRGVIGAGSNRMNIYTVRKTTQGLANFLQSSLSASAVVCYDSRIKSDLFACEAARVLAANGVRVYLFPKLMPTPVLSFAVRYYQAQAGIMITASHNPSKYNGYKCYGPDGGQITDHDAGLVYDCIEKVDAFTQVKLMPFAEAMEKGHIRYVQPELYEAYYQNVLAQQVHPGLCQDCPLKVLYTPLNGTGNVPVREILSRIGLQDVFVVPEQELPDGNFTTCPSPNPEYPATFTQALRHAEKLKPDLLLATDPDSDRVGIAVLHQGEYRFMTGNEVGVLLVHYLLSQRKAQGTLVKDPIIVTTIVTSKMGSAVAKALGAEVAEVLTGFKYIGEVVTNLAKEEQDYRFVFGFEESYGYLAGTYARDKDGVVASMLVCEMAAFYCKQGRTLADVMDGLYKEYGYYRHRLISIDYEGAAGMQRMKEIIANLGENPPQTIGGQKVLAISDYRSSTRLDLLTGETTPIHLPKSSVLSYALPEDAQVVVRPSGTEPKMKIYLTARQNTTEASEEQLDILDKDIRSLLK